MEPENATAASIGSRHSAHEAPLPALEHARGVQQRIHDAGFAQVVLSIDLEGAEERFLAQPHDDENPETVFQRHWAATVLERAMSRLEEEAIEAGRHELFSCLRGHLSGGGERARYREIGERLGLSEGAIKVAVHRSRRRFGQLLRAEIAETVADPADVDAEVRHLLECLRH